MAGYKPGRGVAVKFLFGPSKKKTSPGGCAGLVMDLMG
jgi:hypothetical protein